MNLFECGIVSAHRVVFPSLNFLEKTGECLSPQAELSSQHQPAGTGTLCFARSDQWSWRSDWLSPPEGRGRGSLDCPESRCRAESGWAGWWAVDGGEKSPWWPDNHLFLGSQGSSSLPAPGQSAACRRHPKRTPVEKAWQQGNTLFDICTEGKSTELHRNDKNVFLRYPVSHLYIHVF